MLSFTCATAHQYLLPLLLLLHAPPPLFHTQAVGASERVLQHLNDPPAPQIAPGLVPPNAAFRGNIELQAVGYTYPNRPDAPALSGVDLTLRPGQLTALGGLSGSGKSTLVALLQRLYDPTGVRATTSAATHPRPVCYSYTIFLLLPLCSHMCPLLICTPPTHTHTP